MKHYLPVGRRGFTLIELLVVIGILAVLLAITLIAINPARQFAQANNTKRASDVNALLNAIDQYAADNKGALPAGIDTTVKNISDTGANICDALITKYLAALPVDPLTSNGTPISQVSGACPTPYDTNYTVIKSANDNRITVSAPATELGVAAISVTR
ncbi:MAG TPA: type II secretion system protein [Patescibacteria group bacterium]|jgi:type IV pilus assembly protein PilA|nr:type II secretion system protein [Patescibacteria group bacterium]